jgi:hypothetical protein
MKKILALSLFAMAVLVSQTWAAYSVCTGSTAGWCKWGTECSAIGIDPGASWSKDNCQEAYDNCVTNGELYSDEGCKTQIGGTTACGYWCQWGADCWQIKTDPTGANGDKTTTCDQAIAKCDADGQRWSAAPAGGEGKGTTCGGTLVAGDESCGKYCLWPTGCVEIKTDKSGQYHDGVPVTSCSDALESCSANGQMFDNSSCSGSPDPILKFTPASQALLVAPYGRSLHISSIKDATISLYDMSGARVYNGRVRAGNSVFSLEKVAAGSYYAIVQSGSDVKKIPVILK